MHDWRAVLGGSLLVVLVCATSTEARAEPPFADPATLPPPPAAPAEQAPPAAPVPLFRREASEPRKLAGIVLTTLGAYHGFVGSSILLGFSLAGGGGFGTLYGLLFGGPFMADGLILTAVGIPLWVSGGQEVVGPQKAEDVWRPHVDLGPGNVGATWRF